MTHRRAWIALLIFLAVVINYMDRIALSVAAKPIVAEYEFSPVQMGYLFSGFLWTYVVCLVAIGMIIDRIGVKRLAGGGIAVWSAATALTAAGSFSGILAAQLAMGASEATSFPTGGRIIRDWFPARERGLVTTLFNGGSTAGPALGAIVTAALVSSLGWRVAFLALAGLGYLWLVAWLIWYQRPEEATWLGAVERSKILSKRDGPRAETGTDAPPSSLVYLLRQRSLWGLVLTQACLVYTAYLFLTWLPTYLQSTRALSTMNTGYLTAIPYACTIGLGLVIARVSDRLLTETDIRAGRRRNFIAAMGCFRC
jgi:sugar phosphate permease